MFKYITMLSPPPPTLYSRAQGLAVCRDREAGGECLFSPPLGVAEPGSTGCIMQFFQIHIH